MEAAIPISAFILRHLPLLVREEADRVPGAADRPNSRPPARRLDRNPVGTVVLAPDLVRALGGEEYAPSSCRCTSSSSRSRSPSQG
jgi:hypothetical protein